MNLEGNLKPGQEIVGSVNAVSILTITAYGIAVKNGFKGTEKEWLMSLKMTNEEIEEYVTKYLEEHPVAIDASLSVSGQAADARATGTAINKARPRNLLDNSDFRNPINQRGQSLYEGERYGIDRWRCSSTVWDVSVEDGCIRFSSETPSKSTGMFQQKIAITPEIRGKAITLAAKVKGDYVRLNINNAKTGSYYKDGSNWKILTLKGTVPETGDMFFVALQNQKGEAIEGFVCEWVAVYLGEYTADTLPEYQSKGYGAELAECQRYYLGDVGRYSEGFFINGTGNFRIRVPIPVKMRKIPSVTLVKADNIVIDNSGSSSVVAVTGASVADMDDSTVGVYLKTDTTATSYWQGNSFGNILAFSADL